MKPRSTSPEGLPQPPIDTWELERQEFENLPRLPAILTDVQAGWRFNCTPEGIGILVREKHLDALGGAAPDDCKRFAAVYIEHVSQNRQWLDKATDILYQSRNKKKGSGLRKLPLALQQA
jgi:hypothetical protein